MLTVSDRRPIVATGVNSIAQVAHETLGIDPERVRLIHGDTALTPYSTGTWGSRWRATSGNRQRRDGAAALARPGRDRQDA